METETLVGLIAGTAGLAGTLIGALASIGTTFLTNRHAISIQSKADSIERQEKARAFQRDTLLACQEAMLASARLTGRAHYEDVRALHNGTPWKAHRLSEPLNTDLADNKGTLSLLVERIGNDELRNEIKAVGALLTEVILAHSKQEAEMALMTAIERSEKTMELLGGVLRRTY